MSLFLGRKTKLFVLFGGKYFEIPVLDGYSFSQSTNTTEVTLNEATNAAGASKRGRKVFNSSLSPVEFSFQTYMRPFVNSGTDGVGTNGSVGTTAGRTHTVESILWGLFAGTATTYSADGTTITDGTNTIVSNGATTSDVTFEHSNKSTLGEAVFYFVVSDGDGTSSINYVIDKAVINEASIDFDIEGIATISWSGMGATLQEEDNADGSADIAAITRATANTVYDNRDDSNNFIQNKLTTISLVAVDDSSGNTGVNFQTPFPGKGSGAYDIVATGGSLSISNNLSFLTPEELGVLNTPIAHVTGTRTVSGNISCYLNEQSGGSADLFQDLSENYVADVNKFALVINLGGESGNRCVISLPTAHIVPPTHSVEDVISVDVAFEGLPDDIASTGEVTLSYDT
tara:strand:- start:3099 stop:4301 length:1203 start_codon:yes stop_codon:yes gene_type:complete